jgi:hypothetical protein
MAHCPPSLPLYETDVLILRTGPLKKQSCSGGTRVARDLENIVPVEILIVLEHTPNEVQQFSHYRDHGVHRFLSCGNALIEIR